MRKGACHADKTNALKRIEGQVRGVLRMIDEGRYCIDILNALGAIRGAIKSVEIKILRDHLDSCVRRSFEARSEREIKAKIDEIMDLFRSAE